MKIVYNKIFPFKGFLAINFFGILFVRGEKGKTILSKNTLNHEQIHTQQMKEMLYVFFYIWYFIEWFIKLFIYGFKGTKAYDMISFEREAYEWEWSSYYSEIRKKFSWVKYL